MYFIIYNFNPILIWDYSKVQDSEDATWLVLNFCHLKFDHPSSLEYSTRQGPSVLILLSAHLCWYKRTIMNCAKKVLIWLSMFKSVYLLLLFLWWPKRSLKWPLLVWTLNSYAKFILSTKKCVEKFESMLKSVYLLVLR